MAQVTRIKPQKNKKRVNVYLDGQFSFSLDLDNLLKSGLKVGQVLSKKKTEALIFKNESQKLLDATFRLLSFRPRSEKEIKDYLKKKKAIPKVSGWVIKKLRQQNLINDQVFAKWWLEQRASFRPRGKIALKIELRQKGIDAKTIERLVEKNVNELALAKKAALKKIKAFGKLTPFEFKKKMTSFLSRQGFSWETIKQTLEEITKMR